MVIVAAVFAIKSARAAKREQFRPERGGAAAWPGAAAGPFEVSRFGAAGRVSVPIVGALTRTRTGRPEKLCAKRE
jgi:hypothetical protein